MRQPRRPAPRLHDMKRESGQILMSIENYGDVVTTAGKKPGPPGQHMRLEHIYDRVNAISTVAVIGLGYIGLPTATCLAMSGINVIGVDVNDLIVHHVNRGEVLFDEPELSTAVSQAVAAGFLHAGSGIPEAASAYIIAVPTPVTANHAPDLTAVLDAARAIAPRLRGGELIVLESTCPPGTTRHISELIAALRPDLNLPHQPDAIPDVHLAHCPERVLPGRIMTEITSNDRIIGGLTPACAARAADLYQTFCHGELMITDATSAEMTKLAENAFRDVNIAFANELSLICEHLDLDVWEIRRMANRHPRVDILAPGPGVGGHCIAVDPWFIVSSAPEVTPLIRTARGVNDKMPTVVAAQIADAASKFRDPRIACLGLAFKANVSDLRESPAVAIVERLIAILPGVPILIAEPHVGVLPPQFAGIADITLMGADQAITEADIIALLTDHRAFAAIKPAQLAGKIVYDTRGMWH